jgi:benzoate membrane transport protein
VDRAALTPNLWRDASLSAIVAGFVAVIVGYTSSAAFVFVAARALGADDRGIASWMGALGLGMGITCIALSLAYRAPIVTAWSTPGAALLATSAAQVPLAEAIGAFVLCGLMLAGVGVSGAFDRLMRRLPVALAAAMLAGVLLRFGLSAVGALATDFTLAIAMFAVYLAGRRLFPRYAVPAVLAAGLAVAGSTGRIDTAQLGWTVAQPVFTLPAFSWTATIGLALPLFVVTMASQNVPGMATLRAAGYSTPASPLIAWTGVTTLLLAPFGGYAFNLAAITAAICMGPEAHPDPARRYVAAVAAGVGYCVLGILGGAVGALLGAVPRALVVVIAGLALLGTIGNSLAAGVRDELHREAAVITFLVTASGVTLAGIGSAFWGLAAGLAVRAILKSSPDP